MKFFFKPLFAGVLIASFFSCSQEITAPDRVINTPVAVKALSYKNSIKVKFYGNNREAGFQGYNIYISDNHIDNNTAAVKNNTGGYPTFPLWYSGCYEDGSAESSIILYKDSNNNPIVNHKTYYVKIKAHAVINDKTYDSDFSSEAAVYVLKYTNFVLYNNNVVGQTNDGLALDSVSPVNVPDSGSSSVDIIFQLIMFNGNTEPAFVLNNNIGIENIGYADDIYTDPGDRTLSYSVKKTNIIYTKNLYFLSKNNKEYRIYVKKGVESANNTTDNVNIEIGFGY